MSRSQIHVYAYVLRHAWLNLLSEHITAGRINQVTTKSHRFADQHTPISVSWTENRGARMDGRSTRNANDFRTSFTYVSQHKAGRARVTSDGYTQSAMNSRNARAAYGLSHMIAMQTSRTGQNSISLSHAAASQHITCHSTGRRARHFR